MPIRSLRIPAEICGPPDSANGGFTCGLLAATLGGNAEITLRKPIPLNTEMRIEPRNGPAGVVLLHGEEVIAEGNAADWPTFQVPRISFDTAVAASRKSPAFHHHPFPTCFVCGPERAEGDGLHIFPGPIELDGRNYFAAPWIPAKEYGDNNGNVLDELVWASLDCPTGFAGGFPDFGKLVTGRLGAKVIDPVRVGGKCVLLAWQLGIEGRKHHAACALIGENGAVKAQSLGIWINVSQTNGSAAG